MSGEEEENVMYAVTWYECDENRSPIYPQNRLFRDYGSAYEFYESILPKQRYTFLHVDQMKNEWEPPLGEKEQSRIIESYVEDGGGQDCVICGYILSKCKIE